MVVMRERRKRKAKLKKLLYIFLALLALSAAGAVLVTQVFVIKNVQVDGNELYSDEQIKESLLNDGYSWSSLYVVLKYRLFQVKEAPFIDDMEVSLLSPDTIKIDVYEKAIIGMLETGDQNVYFDKDGFVVEISKKRIDDVPKIEGIDCHKVVVYEKLNIDDEDALDLILAFSHRLQKYNLIPETIVYEEDKTLSAEYGDITVMFGDEAYLEEKVMRLNSIMPQLSGKKGTLHMENWTPVTTDIVFSPERGATKK